MSIARQALGPGTTVKRLKAQPEFGIKEQKNIALYRLNIDITI